MSDRFVKPGNQEHGWNDPPQFSYGLQKDPGGPKRNILNKRVHAPQLTGPGSEMQSTPVAGITPPRGINPPPMDIITPPSMSPRIPSDITAELETEPCIEDVQEPLYWALNACRHTVKHFEDNYFSNLRQYKEGFADRLRLIEGSIPSIFGDDEQSTSRAHASLDPERKPRRLIASTQRDYSASEAAGRQLAAFSRRSC
ncbi:unnamed protein product [Leuciscus chuanchicus]